MTNGQFWFVMICLIVLLDALSYRARFKEQREHREYLAAYDAESKRRHDDFMAALAQERRGRETKPQAARKLPS